MNEPRIVHIHDISLAGKRVKTSLSAKNTSELWRSFKPRVGELTRPEGSGYYAIQVFADDQDFDAFTPNTEFEEWAATEVKEHDAIPSDLESYRLPGGKYAVFIHKGLPSDFPKTSNYIFGEWLPQSFYELDERPHFQLMDEEYDPTDPEAQEEVWIPIRQKELF